MNTEQTALLMEAEDGASLWHDAWLRLKKNRAAVTGGVVLAVMVVLAILTPWIAPYGYEAQNLDLAPHHPLLRTGWVPTFLEEICSHRFSTVDGFTGGWLHRHSRGAGDRCDLGSCCRLCGWPYRLSHDAFCRHPLRPALHDLHHPTDGGLRPKHPALFLAIGAVEWLTMARIMRTQVQSLRQQEFVEAAVSLGLPPSAIIFKHIIPNALGPIIVYTTLTIPSVMLLEAFLSFLGLGIQPPQTSWGLY